MIKTAAELAMQKNRVGIKKTTSIPTNTSNSTSGDNSGGMHKYARAVISTGNADFYQPLVEESTLMLPTKLREILQWCRHFYRSDSLISASVNFHSEFAINGFRNVCEDTKIKKYFDEFAFDIIKLPQLLSFICLEWYKLGNCFKKNIKITTSKGIINIQDIKVGDIVLTHRNNMKKVTNIMHRNVDEQIYYIRIDKVKYSLDCTGEHPIACLRNGKEEWIKARDLIVGDMVKAGRLDYDLYDEDIFLKILSIGCNKEKTKVYNFSVEEDESYVANGVVVHNCYPYGTWNEEDGRWDKFITLNPDYVEIEKTVFSDEPLLKLDPDEGLKRIVTNKKPRYLYDSLDPQIKAYVSKGQKIPLSSMVIQTNEGKFEFPQVIQLARKNSQYETYGTPMMTAAFKILIYKDLLRRAQFSIAKRHWKPIKIVKVGDELHEPTNEVLDSVEEAIRYADEDQNGWLVWHHYISADYIASAGHVLPLQAEYTWIDKELMRAMEISDAVLTNQGMTFANASVSLRVMVNKYQRFQKMLSDFIKNFIYKPVAQVQGFYKTNDDGEKELVIPEIEWELTRLQDDAQLKTVLQNLQQKGLVSRHTVMTYLGLDYDKEKELIKKEQEDDAIFAPTVKPPAGGGVGTAPPGAPPSPGGGGGVPKPPGTPPTPGGVPGGAPPPPGGTPPIAPPGGAPLAGGGETPPVTL
jgi:intein/homing endonuclease